MVKDNQRTLKQDIADLWEQASLPPPQAVQVNQHGDRLEQRRLWTSSDLVGYADWPHLAQVCRVERVVTCKGKTRREVAYAVTSLSPRKASPQRLLSIWRGHWGIENRVHWVRDVTFDEDRCQIRTGAAPQVLAACRNLVIGLLRTAGNTNIAAALRRCATRPHYPLQIIGAAYQ